MGKHSKKFLTLLVGTFFAGPASLAFAECVEDEVRLAGDFGRIAFTVDVADTAQERAQGLMFVEELGDFEGMLFVYERPQSVSFWMRNTLIPLDMIFLDETGTVQHIHENAVPLDETSIFGGSEIQFVLEINGGTAERFGLDVGNVMQHSSIGEDAVYGCDVILN